MKESECHSLSVVHGGDRLLRLLPGGETDETETSTAIRVSVLDDDLQSVRRPTTV